MFKRWCEQGTRYVLHFIDMSDLSEKFDINITGYIYLKNVIFFKELQSKVAG